MISSFCRLLVIKIAEVGKVVEFVMVPGVVEVPGVPGVVRPRGGSLVRYHNLQSIQVPHTLNSAIIFRK